MEWVIPGGWIGVSNESEDALVHREQGESSMMLNREGYRKKRVGKVYRNNHLVGLEYFKISEDYLVSEFRNRKMNNNI